MPMLNDENDNTANSSSSDDNSNPTSQPSSPLGKFTLPTPIPPGITHGDDYDGVILTQNNIIRVPPTN